MTPDGFIKDQRLPSFLSADKTKQQDAGTAWDVTAISSRAIKISIFAAAAALIGIVALQLKYPMTHVPKFMSPLTDTPAGDRDSSASAPAARASGEVEVSASSAGSPPARDDIAVSPPSAAQSQPEANELSSDALFAQFQVWASRQPARAQVEPVSPPDEPGPAPIAVDPPMAAQPLQKPRRPKPGANAAAEPQHVPIPRARLQWGQVAHVEGRPAPTPRVQDPATQSATPSWLQSLSSH